jgi:hypothetical protein
MICRAINTFDIRRTTASAAHTRAGIQEYVEQLAYRDVAPEQLRLARARVVHCRAHSLGGVVHIDPRAIVAPPEADEASVCRQ